MREWDWSFSHRLTFDFLGKYELMKHNTNNKKFSSFICKSYQNPFPQYPLNNLASIQYPACSRSNWEPSDQTRSGLSLSCRRRDQHTTRQEGWFLAAKFCTLIGRDLLRYCALIGGHLKARKMSPFAYHVFKTLLYTVGTLYATKTQWKALRFHIIMS